MEKVSVRLAKKSLNAMLAALEIYNKPECKYREESFCILVINAFELLFKAKILKDNNNKINTLYIYENKKSKKDKILKKKVIKKNRLGQPYTIDMNYCMNVLLAEKKITNNLKENIDILIEIRDNAIHFLNKSDNIKAKIYAICAASIRNYVKILEKWFENIKIIDYNFFITPLNFDSIMTNFDPVNTSVAEKNFLNYIELATNVSSENDEFDVLVNVDIKLSKNSIDEAVLLKYANDGKKINIELSDEMFKKMYPFTYTQIIEMIKRKRPDIKQSEKFRRVKKELQKEEICCKARYLDIVNKIGQPKYYYNSNFVNKLLEKYDST